MAITSSANLRSSIDTTVTDNSDTKRTFVKSFNNGYLYSLTQGLGTGNINNGDFIDKIKSNFGDAEKCDEIFNKKHRNKEKLLKEKIRLYL